MKSFAALLVLMIPMAASAETGDARMAFSDEKCAILGASPESAPTLTPGTAASHSCTVSVRDASMSCVDANGDIGNLVFAMDRTMTSQKQTVWREDNGRSVVYLTANLRYVWTQTEVIPGKGVMHRQCVGVAASSRK